MIRNKISSKDEDYDNYIPIALNESYYLTCMKLCIKDYSTPLDGQKFKY